MFLSLLLLHFQGKPRPKDACWECKERNTKESTNTGNNFSLPSYWYSVYYKKVQHRKMDFLHQKVLFSILQFRLLTAVTALHLIKNQVYFYGKELSSISNCTNSDEAPPKCMSKTSKLFWIVFFFNKVDDK